ncbi:MAG: transcriptional regulator, partial [Desulfobacteraceae bacterium]
MHGNIHEIDGQAVLAFYIPELSRSEKPAYLKGDPRQSFIRRGGGDERCTPRELERFLRDAAKEPFDGGLIDDLDAETFFDAKALSWYRRMFNEREPGRHEMLDDQEFLREWNFVVEEGGKSSVTRCALLLFGKDRHIRRWLPRPVVDFQIIHDRFEEWSPDRRWVDRIVVEDNIIQAWLAIVERYMKHADRPFEVDAATLRRHDEPPDYISFREAAINLLIHQDYGDTGRHAQIQLFRDRTRFWNPGDAFGTVDQLLEPGAKELRNPNLVGAFRRIGLSDQAGTGIRAIFRNWRQLGNIPPKILNQQAEKAFELTLLKEALISEHQERFQRDLGASLNEKQAAILAFACREGQVSLTDAKAITGLTGGATAREVERLVVDVLLKVAEPGRLYILADHLRARYIQKGESGGYCLGPGKAQKTEPGPSWDQVG